MIPYCIIPEDFIWQEIDGYEPRFQEVTRQNIIIQVEGNSIRRLHSTDPSHYLMPDLQPGQPVPEES